MRNSEELEFCPPKAMFLEGFIVMKQSVKVTPISF